MTFSNIVQRKCIILLCIFNLIRIQSIETFFGRESIGVRKFCYIFAKSRYLTA